MPPVNADKSSSLNKCSLILLFLLIILNTLKLTSISNNRFNFRAWDECLQSGRALVDDGKLQKAPRWRLGAPAEPDRLVPLACILQLALTTLTHGSTWTYRPTSFRFIRFPRFHFTFTHSFPDGASHQPQLRPPEPGPSHSTHSSLLFCQSPVLSNVFFFNLSTFFTRFT